MRKTLAAASIAICLFSTLLVGTASAQAIGQVTGVRSTRQDASQFVLTWDRVPGADSYQVRVADNPSKADLGTDNWAVITFLRSVTTYEVTVSAVFDDLEGPASEPISVTTTIPTLIKVTPRIISESVSAIEVKWDVRPAIEAYELFRDGLKIADADDHVGQHAYFDRDVVPGTSYEYQLREVGPFGELGPLGPVAVGTTGGLAPGVTPDAPNVANTFVDKSRAILRIENKEDTLGAAVVEFYRITRDGEYIGSPVEAKNRTQYTWFKDPGLLPGTTYSYEIYAISFDGTEGPASTVDVTTAGTRPFEGPLNLRTTRTEPRTVVLHWDTTPGPSFEVKRDGRTVGISSNGWFVDTTAPNAFCEYTVSPWFIPFIDLVDVAPETINVTTPGTGDDLRDEIERAANATNHIRGPYNYSTLRPTCEGCNFSAETLVWITNQSVVHNWNLPVAHPGVKDPFSVHSFLLDALDSGADVSATFRANGTAIAWSVDGYGLRSDCFSIDTAPPSLVIQYKAEGVYAPGTDCSYGE